MAASTEDARDNVVTRIVESVIKAQARAMMHILGTMEGDVRREVEAQVRAEFGGERAYFGKSAAARNAARDEAIRRDAKPVAEGGAGLSIRQLAKKYHISKSQVARVLSMPAGEAGIPEEKER